MKKLSIILTLLVLFVFGCGNTAAAFALETKGNLDNTAVMDDLKNSTIDGKAFDIANYPYNQNGKPQVIVFAEYCYGYRAEHKGNYALYVYVYNPSGQALAPEGNAIQIATAYENKKPTEYHKFDMQLCDVSVAEHDKLFYKFKLLGVDILFDRVNQSNTERVYDVSGIELNVNNMPTEYNVGKTWTYSGFAKGMGADVNAESTLTCSTDLLETVSLEVTPTYWRYNNSATSQTQITSVYFGLDNRLLQEYGYLQKIHAQWLKARTSDIIVSNDKGLYDIFYPYIGKDIGSRDEDLKYYLYLSNGFGGWTWSYNGSASAGEIMTKMPYLLYTGDTDTDDVSSEALLEYMEWYSNKFGNKTVAGKYNPDLFANVDTNVTDLNIDANATFDVDGFDAGALGNWWNSITNQYATAAISGIKPIYIIQDNDLSGSNETVANRLYIAESDVAKLRSDYAANKAANKKTVLFRFATSEYYANDITAREHTLFASELNNRMYKASQEVYLNFDIIDLTFSKDGVQTVLPVVSSPVDIVGDVTEPPNVLEDLLENVSNIWDIIKIVAIVCVALLALSIVIKIIRGIFKG